MNNKPKRKRQLRWKPIAWIALLFGFLLMNVVAMFHAYQFTHFSTEAIVKTKKPAQLSFGQKLETLLFGIKNPRPTNAHLPDSEYSTIHLRSNVKIECWLVKAEKPHGTVIICHGFSGQKSSMLDKADEFLKLGYSTLLVDFMGSGGSEGNQTTLGYDEAQEVKTCYDYLQEKGETNIYLFGTSMGAVAIMKAMKDYALKPKGIIIECPFGSMYQTVAARFETMKVPPFPMAGLLVFWGGIENGFWAFGHNPVEYAEAINCPTLLLYGAKDLSVSKGEIDEIYNNLQGEKQLRIYPEAGHENYLTKYKEEWVNNVADFFSLTEK